MHRLWLGFNEDDGRHLRARTVVGSTLAFCRSNDCSTADGIAQLSWRQLAKTSLFP